jgi:arabinogalactan oligomer/maltooligosaccharide transport system substrate-binding protein
VGRDPARRTLLGAAALVVAAAVAGCTATAPPPSPSPSVGGQLVWWDISTRTGALAADRSLIAGFVAANPGVKVDVQVLSPDDARARFDTTAQTAAGAPDVLTVDTAWVPDFVLRGYLAPLDETVAAAGADDVFPALAKTQRVDGRLYAVTRSADGLALLYNPKALARAKVTKVPTTWAEVAAAQLPLTATDVQTLYAPTTGEGLLPFVYGEGGSLLDADAKTITVSQPAAVAGLAERVELAATGVTVDEPPGGATATPTASSDTATASTVDASVDAMRTEFRQGRVAMILDNAAAIPSLVGGAAFATQSDVGVAPVPGGTVRASSPLTATAYVVYAGSKNLETAYRLVSYLGSPQSQAALAERLGLVPSRPEVFQRPEVKADAVVAAFEPVVRGGTVLPVVPQQPMLLPPVTDALRTALAGQGSPQSVLDDVATAYLRLLPGYSVGPSTA